MLSKKFEEDDRLYIEDGCLANLLLAQDRDEGWFIAAPGYRPYGDYVWQRDNAECVIALDMYASSSGRTDIFERTEKALVRSFRAVEEKEEGIRKLSSMKRKLFNPEFYDDKLHPHCRLTREGKEVVQPWNNIQYDSIARMLIALEKHINAKGKVIPERFEKGVHLSVVYLFDAIWDEIEGNRWLTVCANEWEEKDEPHIGGPLFSSVVGTILAASRSVQKLQNHFNLPDVREYEKITAEMLKGFFAEKGSLKMLKRYKQPASGTCSTSLWLLNDFEVFPDEPSIFKKTVSDVVKVLYSENLKYSSKEVKLIGGLRRYMIPAEDKGIHGFHHDRYWGGQAWVITTAQLSRSMAAIGLNDAAETLLKNCIETRDHEGRLPEQIEGTYLDHRMHEAWMQSTGESSPPPWLAWSHAEVLKAYVTLKQMNIIHDNA